MRPMIDKRKPKVPPIAAQPFTPHWFPKDIVDWWPNPDGLRADDIFNRSRVPLARRVWDQCLAANDRARAEQGDVLATAVFGNTTGNPSQGARGKLAEGFYAFGYWQYLGALTAWGGSASEGLIVAPSPTIVDAAHRNGVPVYGTVFFPTIDRQGGDPQWVRDFTDDRMPDALIRVATYFGFDGWFINQETDDVGPEIAAAVAQVMAAFESRRSGLALIWYDAMDKNGKLNYQNELTDDNVTFFQDGRCRRADGIFLNYWWSTDMLSSSASYARDHGRSGYDVYAGVLVGEDKLDAFTFDTVFQGRPRDISAGLFSIEWTAKDAIKEPDFFATLYALESKVWVGPAGDPRVTTPNVSWQGVATSIAERTTITSTPFMTTFNTGHGTMYAVDGVRYPIGVWHNMSLQDVLPTYRWCVDSGGSRLNVGLDFTDAYQGGASLLLSGTLDAANTIRLYQTRLPVTGTTTVSFAVKAEGGPGWIDLGVRFAGDAGFTYFTMEPTNSNDWALPTPVSLGDYAGRTIIELGLRIRQMIGPPVLYRTRIGRLIVLDAEPPAPNRPGPVAVLLTEVDRGTQALRLQWAETGPVHHYDVFAVHGNGARDYVGGCVNNAYFVPAVTRLGAERQTTIEVVGVGPSGKRSPASPTTITW